jgi:hypothetical protein
MVYCYPPYPTSTSALGFIEGLIEWIIGVPMVAIANFIEGIAGSVTSAGQTDATDVIGFIGTTWNGSVASFSAFGIFAPIAAAFIWGVGILVLIFFIFKAVQLATRETEEA